MTRDSHDSEVRDLLVTALPTPDARAHESWEDVLARAGLPAPSLRTTSARRRWLVVFAGLALMLAAGAAIAAVTVDPWWEDAEPPVNPRVVHWQLAPPADGSNFPPAADRSRARTVARDHGAALVAAPIGRGGYCIIPSLRGRPDLGFSCVYQPGDELRSYALPPSAKAPRWIIYGRITDPDAAALDLSEAAGVTFVVPLRRGGFFLANVPESRWNDLSGQAGRGRIVDESGETLRTGCVSWGPSPHGAGAGLTRYPFWSEREDPCRPRPVPTRPTVDLDRAEKLVAVTLSFDFSIWRAGTEIALWRAPANEGRECVYVAPASPRPQGTSQGLPGGGSCVKPGPPRRSPLSPFGPVSVSRSSDGGLVSGEVERTSGIVRVELRSGTRSTRLALNDGYFLGELPEARLSAPFPPDGPLTIIGYDAAGKEVGSLDLARLHRGGAPG
jgi:hypothetical protein